MSIKQSSHFRYGAIRNSSVEILDEDPVLKTKFFPSTSLDANRKQD